MVTLFLVATAGDRVTRTAGSFHVGLWPSGGRGSKSVRDPPGQGLEVRAGGWRGGAGRVRLGPMR